MGPAGLRREGCLAAAATAVFSLVLGGLHSAGAAAPSGVRMSAVDGPAHRSTTNLQAASSAPTLDQTLTDAIRARLSKSTGSGFAAAVDIDGVGPVVRLNAAHASHPASTQKLFTTGPILQRMSQQVLTTEVRARAHPSAGVVHGNLVVVARRDPTMTRAALHTLAKAVHAAGVHRVTGRLNIDVGGMSMQTRRDGWKADSVPWDIGPLSPFPVNEDAYRRDSAYVAHPTESNASLFRQILRDEGVRVVGRAQVVRSTTASVVLASRRSATFQHMVKHTLRESDNFYAESFLFIEGAWRVQRLVRDAAVPDATFTDGSGLSYTDRESARGEVKLLHYLRQSNAGALWHASLPVGCRSGTLLDWFCHTIGEDNVWAKTGTLLHDRDLAGFTTDARGREVTFSVLVHGVRDLTAARKAIAQAVIAMRRYSGS
jgi:D-alanyl-D-alanine carboxypeptidase/D-alanyl-D-alanine-endopeptidase (penicillin-binding protein 4)